MNQNQYKHLKQRYEKLKKELYHPPSYPYLNSILSLPHFLKQNEALYIRMINEIRDLRSFLRSTAQKRQIKIKTSPYYLQNSVSSASSNRNDDALGDLVAKNQILRANIAMLRQQNEKKQAQQAPVLKEKQQELKERREEAQRLAELNRQLKKAIENEQVLELYELKCRECESLRLVNNELSDQLKKLITQLNKLTGSDENPNMFLLSLGIH